MANDNTQPNCRACKHSYMEPDSPLICGHPDAGSFGLYLHKEPAPHCKDFSKFEQHPFRKPNGDFEVKKSLRKGLKK